MFFIMFVNSTGSSTSTTYSSYFLLSGLKKKDDIFIEVLQDKWGLVESVPDLNLSIFEKGLGKIKTAFNDQCHQR